MVLISEGALHLDKALDIRGKGTMERRIHRRPPFHGISRLSNDKGHMESLSPSSDR